MMKSLRKDKVTVRIDEEGGAFYWTLLDGDKYGIGNLYGFEKLTEGYARRDWILFAKRNGIKRWTMEETG